MTIGLVSEGAKIHLYAVTKTDGHRSRQNLCADCDPLQIIQSPAHLVSMATANWRLTPQILDEAIKKSTLILASLCFEQDSTLALEPDSGHPYRVRIVSCSGTYPMSSLNRQVLLTF